MAEKYHCPACDSILKIGSSNLKVVVYCAAGNCPDDKMNDGAEGYNVIEAVEKLNEIKSLQIDNE
jgi:hypothetical protein